MDPSNSGDVEAPKDPGALQSRSSLTDTEILGECRGSMMFLTICYFWSVTVMVRRMLLWKQRGCWLNSRQLKHEPLPSLIRKVPALGLCQLFSFCFPIIILGLLFT